MHRDPGHLAYFETILECRFCRCTHNTLPLDVLVDGIVVTVHGGLWHFAYFEATLDCRFCRYTQGSRAFGLLRNDLGMHILSLRTGVLGILPTVERTLIANFVAIRRAPAYLAYFETILD
jgi:hypothetical protein